MMFKFANKYKMFNSLRSYTNLPGNNALEPYSPQLLVKLEIWLILITNDYMGVSTSSATMDNNLQSSVRGARMAFSLHPEPPSWVSSTSYCNVLKLAHASEHIGHIKTQTNECLRVSDSGHLS